MLLKFEAQQPPKRRGVPQAGAAAGDEAGGTGPVPLAAAVCENIHRYPMFLTSLECQDLSVSALANGGTRARAPRQAAVRALAVVAGVGLWLAVGAGAAGRRRRLAAAVAHYTVWRWRSPPGESAAWGGGYRPVQMAEAAE
jgi:hypothetical protein